MWRTAFSGSFDFGTGSAIAVFLFLLVVPVLALNVRRFRRDV
jgi:alpha-glucoside transport system permease protein